MAGNIQDPNEKNRVTAASIPPEIMAKMIQSKVDQDFKSGKKGTDIYWEAFLASQLESDFDRYLEFAKNDGEDVEKICYELFLDFSQGRKNPKSPKVIKSIPLAEMALSKIQNPHDVEKLLAIVSFYEQNHNVAQSDSFYMKLYEIFCNGEGTQKDLNQAAKYLKCAIKVDNTDERRLLLRNIYVQQNSSLEENDAICKAYEKMIAENIPSAKSDYANYLKSHDKRLEAVHWLIADERYEEAYENIDLTNKTEIDNAISEMKKGAADSEFSGALKLMSSSYGTLKDIFACKEKPLPYWTMALLYTFVGLLYTPYHTVKLNIKFFVVGLLLTLGAGIGCGIYFNRVQVGIWAVITVLAVWAIISLIVDVQRRRKFLAMRELWEKLQAAPHPQLQEKEEIFSENILGKANTAWVLTVPFVILLATPIKYGLDILNNQAIFNEYNATLGMETSEVSVPTNTPPASNRDSESPVAATDNNNLPASNNDSSGSVAANNSSLNANNLSSSQRPETLNNTAPANTTSRDSGGSTAANEVPVKNPPAAPATPSPEQQAKTAAADVVVRLHQNITNKNYRQAFNCYSKDYQSRMDYQKWVDGFKTTVSSTALNVNVVELYDDEATVKFNLEAVDNPGGTRNFTGTYIVVKEADGWKIASTNHKPMQ